MLSDRVLSEIESERLPCVLVDLDAFDRNLQKACAIAAKYSKTVRIATKSIRVPALIRRAIEHGSPVKGLMCFSVEEAHFLSQQGFDELLVAYPTVMGSDLNILRNLHQKGVDISCVVDDLEQAHRLNDVLGSCKKPFPIVVEIDGSYRLMAGSVHLGVRRSPIHSVRQLEEFLDSLRTLAHVQPIGMMVYEAQVAGLGDRNPFKKALNPIVGQIRRRSMEALKELRIDLAQVFQKKGLELKIFNGGGSGSFNWTSEEKTLSEVTLGSGLLCSHLFDYYSNISYEPACYFALQACRRPAKKVVTCLGGGYVASGEPGLDRLPVPLNGKLLSAEGAGEVQTPVRFSSDLPRLGAPVLFRHAKAGELAERFKEYILFSKGKIQERVKTYRGLGECFF